MREATSSKLENVSDEVVSPPMDINVEHWVQREIQLNQLHEEILAQREALLHFSEDHVGGQEVPERDESDLVKKASERNKNLLQDIATAQSKLTEDGRRPVSPRFTTLQNNYSVMVKNVSPVWEEELLDYKQKQRVKQQQQRSPGLQRRTHQTSPKFHRTSPKVQRASPKQQRTSPKLNRTMSDRVVLR
ncbi:uncharacterized protein LOC135475556 [Liolophura sinensis]|uniref:uncharacterized protein LOC135475556 n=1 Tax=Liolophura sinensis TaxID=3198878 RepID=UPI003157FC02